MTAAFHRFNLLPLELRQRIWELSLDPRRVPVGNFGNLRMLSQEPQPPPPPVPPPAPPPAALHACTESRTYLARYYTKIFINGSSSRYQWVNYDLDTICMNFWTLQDLPDELPPIKHFSVVANDCKLFMYNVMGIIRFMSSLEDLELKPVQEEPQGRWWYYWTSVMRYWYHADDPVSFRAIIVSPVPDDKVPELNQGNYLKVDRDLLNMVLAANPGMFTDRDVPDSETLNDMRQCAWYTGRD